MGDNGTAHSAEVLVESEVNTPDGLAVDWIHGNLYWTDTGKNCIEVLSLRNPAWRRQLISEHLDEPRAIVVDPRNSQRSVSVVIYVMLNVSVYYRVRQKSSPQSFFCHFLSNCLGVLSTEGLC